MRTRALEAKAGCIEDEAHEAEGMDSAGWEKLLVYLRMIYHSLYCFCNVLNIAVYKRSDFNRWDCWMNSRTEFGGRQTA